MDQGEAQDVRDRLLKMPCTSLGMPGLPFPTEDDCYVIDNNDTTGQVHARLCKSVEEGDVDRAAY
jgi:hypothetical protein